MVVKTNKNIFGQLISRGLAVPWAGFFVFSFLFVFSTGFILSGCRTEFGGGNKTPDGGTDSLCGDGVLDDGEGCDDGNTENGDGCDENCEVEPGWYCQGEPSVCESTCGDGVRQEWEECDGEDLGGESCDSLGEGFKGGELGCTEECTFVKFGCVLPGCGDGVLDFGEECDDGEENSNDGECLVNCRKATCGDGFVWLGDEECDDGAGNSDTEPNACRTDCREAWCGDGVLDSGEECDDEEGNSDTQPNACRMDCREAWCGDGVLDSGEQCDDGAGNSDSTPNVCRTNCELPSCGDGVADSGEQCDDGGGNSDTQPNACRTNCVYPSCGDGVVDSGEECDDGNNISGDGCSANCQVENLPTLHWISSNSQGWSSSLITYAGDNHAPTSTIVAAANVQERNEVYVFTRSKYHVLSVPGRSWIANGTLSSTFSGIPANTFHAAHGVSWPDTSSSDILIFNGSQYYYYHVQTSSGYVYANSNNPGYIDWSDDPLAPNPGDIKASYVALENGKGWVDCSPQALCGLGGTSTGPYGVLLTTDNKFYIQESGSCFQVCSVLTPSQFQPFGMSGAPSASQVRAMAYANGVLYVITQ